MTVRLTNRWKTVCIVGYQSIATECENRSAHGGVCLVPSKDQRQERQAWTEGQFKRAA